MATVLAFRNEPHQRFFHAMLDSGEEVVLRLDAMGLTIERVDRGFASAAVLFSADADRASRIALGLLGERKAKPDAVLAVMLAAVMALGSADQVREAFAAAAGAASQS